MFIVIEGIDGSGKSTFIKKLKNSYDKLGSSVVTTYEPYFNRDTILKGVEKSPINYLQAFIQDRNKHINEIIKPALQLNKVVLCDRYFLSTYAYQIYNNKELKNLFEESIRDIPKPDLIIFLDTPIDVCISRQTDIDNLSNKDKDYFIKVREGYTEGLKLYCNDRYLILNRGGD